LNNALEQDHRAIKQRVNASQGLPVLGLLHRFILGLFAAT
jgi:hypothetical protein